MNTNDKIIALKENIEHCKDEIIKILQSENEKLKKQLKEYEHNRKTTFFRLEKSDIQDIIDNYDDDYKCSDEMIDKVFEWIKNDYDGRAIDDYYRTLGEDIVDEFGSEIQGVPKEDDE